METNSEIDIKLIIYTKTLLLATGLLVNLRQVPHVVLRDYLFVVYLEGTHRSVH